MEANKNRSIDALHSFCARTKTGLPAKTGHAAYRLRSIRRFNELDLYHDNLFAFDRCFSASSVADRDLFSSYK